MSNSAKHACNIIFQYMSYTSNNELGMNRVASFADDRYLLSKFLCFELIAGHKITKACGKIRSGLRIKCRKGRTFFGNK